MVAARSHNNSRAAERARPQESTRHLAGLVVYSVIEQFGYRQLTALWRLRALVQALRAKHRGHWGTMDRRGLVRAG